MNRNSQIIRAVRASLALVAGAGAWMCTMPALAQETGAGAEPQLEVTVVGSRIRRVDVEGPTPVVTIDAQDFEKRGYATVTDALNDLSQNAGGGFDQQNTFGFTPSASAIDLRGFGAGRTLVLVDGRRLPVFPLASSGTDNFVDLSSIPVGAIERVEVLTDGASAIYGSDAVSGVVNIVMKKQADNALSARLSDTQDGGGGQQRVQFSVGTENLAGGTASFFAEFFKQDEMMFTDRDYSRSDRIGGVTGPGPGIFSGFGDPGTFVSDDGPVPAPNCSTAGDGPGTTGGICRFNRAPYRQLVPAWEQYSATGRYERPMTDNISFFSRATYFHSVTDTQLEPMAYDQGGTDGFGIQTPVGAASNPTTSPGVWRRRLTEFGPRQEEITNNTINLLAGVRGELGERYNWEFGVSYVEQRTVSINNGFARKSDMNALVYGSDPDGDGIGSGGTLNLFNTIPQSLVDQLRISPRGDGISSLGGADFQVDGDLFEFAGRTVKFASILEFNKQRFADTRSQEVLDGDVVALGGSNGRGDRKYSAFGTELEMAVFDNFTVNVAGRYDNYDDDSNVGGAFSPRIAMEYRPVERLLFRGSAGKSFRAPDLQRLFGAETAAFTDVIDTPKCIEDGGSGRGDVSVPACFQQAQSIAIATGGNVALTEEKGENFNVGVVFEPFSGLTLSTDFFYITLEQIVNTPSVQFILDANAADGSFADAITRDPQAEDPLQNPGGILEISQTARNLSFQRMSGVDLRADMRIPTENLGNFTARIAGTYLNDLKIQEQPGEPIINALAEGILGEFVRFRGVAEVGWSRGILGANVLVSHLGGFTPLDPTAVDRIDSWTTVNIGGTVETPWNSTVAVGVNNVFDEEPPLDLSLGDVGQPFYNQFFHDPFGATWHVTYTQRF
jgi:iron complex outermembrane receptor protein